MKVVQINTICGHGSTGRICAGISKVLTAAGIENYVIASSESSFPLSINCGGGKGYTRFQALKSRLLGNYGFNSKRETQRILRELDRISPDIVHLHNIHGHDCDLRQLFAYFRKKNIRVFWTFHDCWAFTGYCTHFTLYGCDKWMQGCFACPQFREYSWLIDRSREMYRRKKVMLEGVDLTVITPSEWLAGLVRQSFLRDKRVITVNNGIDPNAFKPTQSSFRASNGIREDQHLVLGVAAGWSNKKGLDVFIELARRLDPEQFRIVLVGTTSDVDKTLPSNIISIHRTQDQTRLAEIYTAADLFVNTTREDVLCMVNLEALACGTPVITFRTGGSPECIDETCGRVVDCNDTEALIDGIKDICSTHPFSRESCIRRVETHFEEYHQYAKITELYQKATERRQ